MSAKRNMTTIVDVAREAKVSVGTVSNVLNGTGRVSVDTIKRVRDTMEALNFQPNDMARGLRVIHSKLIGFIIPDTSEFYMKIAKSFMKLAYQNGYTVLLADYDYSFEREKSLFDMLIQKRSEVIVVLGGSFDEEYLQEMHEKGTKILLIDRRIDDSDLSTIEFDNVNTVRSLVGKLHQKGYKKIGFFSETVTMTNVEDRYKGYLRGLADNRLLQNDDFIYIYSELQLEKRSNAYDIMKNILKTKKLEDLPEAFICTADSIAVGIMDAMKDYGFKIPEDIAVVGFDNSVISEYVTPTLTTVEQNTQEMGVAAWEMVNNMITDKIKIKRQMHLAQNILFRESCRVK